MKGIFVYTPLCGTCKVAAQMIRVVREMRPDFIIEEKDLNLHPDLAQQYLIESVPCLLLFRDGALAEKIYAFQSVPYLLDKIGNDSC